MRVLKNKKMKSMLVFAIMFLLASSLQIVSSDKINLKNNELIIYSYPNDNELKITFELQNLQQNQIITEHGIFELYKINDKGFLGVPGKPQLPVVTCLFAVPTFDIKLNIINSHIYEKNSVGQIYPAQMPQQDSDNGIETDLIIDKEFYKQDVIYPGNLIEIVDYGKIRDIPFIKIEFYPIQYNPKQELVTIYDEITIQLSWDDNEIVQVETNFYNAPYLRFYKNVFQNWQGFIEHSQITEPSRNLQDGGCDYLIITHPDFYTEISELAEWKNSKGIITKLVDTTETGTTSVEIRQYIKDAYENWDPRPSYILLVGDDAQIPTNFVSGTGTDLYYATVDGSDYFPDLFIGRIPVDTSQEANIVVQKILTYEQTPPDSSSFYENFAVAAYFQDDDTNGYEDRRFVKTSEEIRDFLLSNDYQGERIYCTASYINPTHYNQGTYAEGEPLPEELLRPEFAWDGNTEDIINAIEQGVFIITHRDHGLEDGWDQPNFLSSHIEGLTNGELLPVVFSMNCLTGTFYNYECFCEKFIKKEGGGCVAIFGASDVSYSGYNDYLCRGMFDSMWPDFDTEVGTDQPMYSLGEMLNYGKMYMSETWGDPWGYEQLTFELFHCFGDPTMEIWSALPQELDVSIKLTEGSLQIDVECNVEPVSDALVCLSQLSGYYAKGLTDDSGSIIIDVSSAIITEDMQLTISAHNCQTYLDTFILNQKPATPIKPMGPTKGKTNEYYPYTTSTEDPDGDEIYYMWDWGDGNQTIWMGPYDSGENANAGWIWKEKGTYEIKVKAKDVNGAESDWSETLRMDITHSRYRNNLLTRMINNFSDYFPMLDYMIRLFN